MSQLRPAHTAIELCLCTFFPTLSSLFPFFPQARQVDSERSVVDKASKKKKNGTTCLFTCDKNSLAVLSLFVCLFFVARHYFSASCSLSLCHSPDEEVQCKKKKIEVRYMFYLQVQSVNYASPLSLPLSCISFFFSELLPPRARIRCRLAVCATQENLWVSTGREKKETQKAGERQKKKKENAQCVGAERSCE